MSREPKLRQTIKITYIVNHQTMFWSVLGAGEELVFHETNIVLASCLWNLAF